MTLLSDRTRPARTAVDLVALDGAATLRTNRRALLPRPGVLQERRAPLTLAITLVAVLWSGWELQIGRRAMLNGNGFREVRRFFATAVRPDVSGTILRGALTGARTTLAYALLGTILSVGIGLAIGVLVTRARRDGQISIGARGVRALLTPLRGMHEVLWALLLLNVLGINPLVAVLSIAIPFGAVTARVFAELLEAQPRDAYNALRASGARESTAFLAAILPGALADGTTYTFYRFECAVRAAAVLGIVGAGGLGEQLKNSYDSLNYREMWTFLYCLIAISALADAASARIRKRSSRTAGQRTILGRSIATVVLTGLATWTLHIKLSTLWSKRTRTLAGEIFTTWFPPSFSREHVNILLPRARETLAIAIGSIVISLLIALPLAFAVARSQRSSTTKRIARAVGRFVLLVARAIPASIWAFLAVLAFFSGPFPAAVALGIYNAGVLGRLLAEAVENLDQRPRVALEASGAKPTTAAVIGLLPSAAPKIATYGLYRWEVAMRETIVVSIAAAGGLGLHINDRRAAFDWPDVTASIIVLVLLTYGVEVVSSRVRATLHTR